ncbi:hypothetical protein BGX26_000068 [Mortierella sp. AD094]|nr:hypothetical protein BGX26_000068 [Mortierella sp. AD094]
MGDIPSIPTESLEPLCSSAQHTPTLVNLNDLSEGLGESPGAKQSLQPNIPFCPLKATSDRTSEKGQGHIPTANPNSGCDSSACNLLLSQRSSSISNNLQESCQLAVGDLNSPQLQRSTLAVPMFSSMFSRKRRRREFYRSSKLQRQVPSHFQPQLYKETNLDRICHDWTLREHTGPVFSTSKNPRWFRRIDGAFHENSGSIIFKSNAKENHRYQTVTSLSEDGNGTLSNGAAEVAPKDSSASQCTIDLGKGCQAESTAGNLSDMTLYSASTSGDSTLSRNGFVNGPFSKYAGDKSGASLLQELLKLPLAITPEKITTMPLLLPYSSPLPQSPSPQLTSTSHSTPACEPWLMYRSFGDQNQYFWGQPSGRGYHGNKDTSFDHCSRGKPVAKALAASAASAVSSPKSAVIASRSATATPYSAAPPTVTSVFLTDSFPRAANALSPSIVLSPTASTPPSTVLTSGSQRAPLATSPSSFQVTIPDLARPTQVSETPVLDFIDVASSIGIMDIDLFGACYIKAIKEFDMGNAEHLERYQRLNILVNYYFGQSGEVPLLTEHLHSRETIQAIKEEKSDGDAGCGDNEDGSEGYDDRGSNSPGSPAPRSWLTDSQSTPRSILKRRNMGESNHDQSDKHHRSGHLEFNEMIEVQYYNPKDMPCRASMELTMPIRKAVSLSHGLDKRSRQQVLPSAVKENIDRKYHISSTKKANSAQGPQKNSQLSQLDNRLVKGEVLIPDMGDSANSPTPPTAVEPGPDLDDGSSERVNSATLISLIAAPHRDSVQTYFAVIGQDNLQVPYPPTYPPPEVLNINPEDYTDLMNSDIDSILSDPSMASKHTKNSSIKAGVRHRSNAATLVANDVAFNLGSDSSLDEALLLFPTPPRQVSPCLQEPWTPRYVPSTSDINSNDSFTSRASNNGSIEKSHCEYSQTLREKRGKLLDIGCIIERDGESGSERQLQDSSPSTSLIHKAFACLERHSLPFATLGPLGSLSSPMSELESTEAAGMLAGPTTPSALTLRRSVRVKERLTRSGKIHKKSEQRDSLGKQKSPQKS